MSIIEVNHLTKEYQLGQITSLKDSALNAVRRLTFQRTKQRERFKALDDVNFHIEEGEVVGIIGHNGAGKSTLLKHLANITNPTKGKVIVRGSVAPMIEVGAGVNPELTGRENIFLNGAILGIQKKIIRQKLDEIIDFSELEQFIDTPVKRYSSGMKIKLGFSIATSMDSDILIIDEVLAVGDLAFQRKCISRIENVIKCNNRTVLLVSHNLRQVARLCTRAILLSKGKVVADGNPSEICENFYAQSNQKVISDNQKTQSLVSNIRSSGEFELNGIEIIDSQGKPTESINSGEKLHIVIDFTLNNTVIKPEIVIGTHTTDFFYLTTSTTASFSNRPDLEKGRHQLSYIIPRYPLITGTYCIRIAIRDIYGRSLFTGETLKIFSVLPIKGKSIEAVDEATKYSIISTECKWLLNKKEYIENNYSTH